MTKNEWIETKVYTFRELLTILVQSKTKKEINELSDYIMTYKKKYSLLDLHLLKTFIQYHYDNLT